MYLRGTGGIAHITYLICVYIVISQSCKGRERGFSCLSLFLSHKTNTTLEKEKGRNKGPSARVSGNTPFLTLHGWDSGPRNREASLRVFGTSLLVEDSPATPSGCIRSSRLDRSAQDRPCEMHQVLYNQVLYYLRAAIPRSEAWNAGFVLLKFSGYRKGRYVSNT